ncbi:hypothetical protein [Actinopolyspora mortivallis]|uniref:Uncharacterized protein n=1 Tax=Actinopolyspora mortivallis TaxID=33906 RepID=A0A2T0GT30_ACTMO|nr:hypothetical protein [Actinopolyspora mortivallis]PRW62275.1 hypothetical protein CEP50_16170 [Actinopolyspora mortivallis]
MVDLAMVALVLVALLAVWLFLRGPESGARDRRRDSPPHRRSETAPPRRRPPAEHSENTHGPRAYRAKLLGRRPTRPHEPPSGGG